MAAQFPYSAAPQQGFIIPPSKSSAGREEYKMAVKKLVITIRGLSTHSNIRANLPPEAPGAA